MLARQAVSVPAPKHAADPAAEHIRDPHGINIGDRWSAEDGDGIAPAISTLVDPESYLRVVHIDDIRQAVTIHIADQNAPWVIAPRKMRAILHVNPLAPVTVTEVGPVFHVPIADQRDRQSVV